GQPWLVSQTGKWIAPLRAATKANLKLDFPLLIEDPSEEAGFERLVEWLQAIEESLKPYLVEVFEVNGLKKGVRVLVRIKYASQSARVLIVGGRTVDPTAFNRLKRVVQYLI